MAHIFCIMGKSSTGKDTIYKKLLEDTGCSLEKLVPYTTRPIREGEMEGVEYHFTDEKGYQDLLSRGKVVEQRSYDTCYGLWRYFTVDDGTLLPKEKDYLVIGTLEAYRSIREYFGEEVVCPILIELDDGIRLQRALDREKLQKQPKYEELCRRFLADQEDFSAEKIQEAAIPCSFQNDDLQECLDNIVAYIRDAERT